MPHTEDCHPYERIEIDLLLEGIYRQYGYDFRDYSFPSIRRRIWRRIYAERLASVTALLDLVLHDKEAMERLFNDFSVHVTEMFRDPMFFLTLRRKVLPALRHLPYIRIWHAGCSTGEEVYSMNILLHEENLLSKTRLYATDMNKTLLERARRGTVPLEKMQLYTKNYFQAGGNRAFSEYYTVQRGEVFFSSRLSDNVVFSQHNLATDHSFNEFHLIICRNVLIYFNDKLQKRVMELFGQSLNAEGFLGLGNKEAISSFVRAGRYREIDTMEKIYRKVPAFHGMND